MKKNVFVIGSNDTSKSEHLRIETFNIGDNGWKKRDIDGEAFVCKKSLNCFGK